MPGELHPPAEAVARVPQSTPLLQREVPMRRVSLIGCVLAGATGFGASSASAAVPPDPCTVLHPSKIAAAVHPKAVPHSHLGIRHELGKTFRTCTWGKGKTTFSITTGPSYTLGGFGGPPGTISTHPVEGLGAKSWYAHDDNPAYQYADVLFMHAPFSGDVHINGNLPFADILALARSLYKAE